jgi:transposase-like protein
MLHNGELPRLAKCPCGKSNPHRHGTYDRKADRTGTIEESLNPVPIQRYYCPECKKTCSVLPECIAHNRWYLWEIQALALLLVFSKKSIFATANKMQISRQTISRWAGRLKEQLIFHKDILCNIFTDLGRTATDLNDFWLSVFKQINFGAAMRFCHIGGVNIP